MLLACWWDDYLGVRVDELDVFNASQEPGLLWHWRGA